MKIFSIFGVISLLFSFVLGGCSVKKQAPPESTVADAPCLSAPLRVDYVVDGDTIIVVNESGQKEKVRLIGVDTPESVHADASKNTREGKIVSERVSMYLRGKKVQLESDVEKYDKYGRRLAYVYVDGRMLNKLIVAAGLGKALIIPPNTKHADEFLEVELSAMKNGDGFWGAESSLFVEEAKRHG